MEIAPPQGRVHAQSLQTNPLRQRAEELEGVFLHVMLSSAFAGLGEEDAFASQSTDTWRGLQIEHLANEIASQAGIGLADQLFAELISLQEVDGAK